MAPTDRRTFLQGAAGAGGTLAVTHKHKRRRRHARGKASDAKPNILTILVDQLRTPVWMPPTVPAASVMPNLNLLRERAVSFENHYTAANDCSPSRSTLLTGLYSHQTNVLVTGSGWLDPAFPTWGKLLRGLDYETVYYGKWHLTPNVNAPLGQYGFAGGTYPSPNGKPGQGTRVDPLIAMQFEDWFAGHSQERPWATTVSFVNPHDLAWWHRYTEDIEAEANPPALALGMPPNYETPEQLAGKGKPELQRALQETAARSFGAVPFTGPETEFWWRRMMDTYLLLQGYVDLQIGKVLATLASRPDVAERTVVIFTSDHGEYAGSHGMRGKGASAYEEALRVPLYVYDPRGLVTAAPQAGRSQLTSSVDIVGLMLSIAYGSERWRTEPQYSHLAQRLDLAAICRDPAAPGRDWVLHATDETVTEFAPEALAYNAARHLIAIRSERGKLGLYSNWVQGGTEPAPTGQEVEFYDYSSEEGRLELSSQNAPPSALHEELNELLVDTAIPQELQAPLPAPLEAARAEGLARFLGNEEREELKVYEAHHHPNSETGVEAL